MKKILNFAIHINGRMAERLGSGLQNHLHRFESGSDLKKALTIKSVGAFYIYKPEHNDISIMKNN